MRNGVVYHDVHQHVELDRLESAGHIEAERRRCCLIRIIQTFLFQRIEFFDVKLKNIRRYFEISIVRNDQTLKFEISGRVKLLSIDVSDVIEQATLLIESNVV